MRFLILFIYLCFFINGFAQVGFIKSYEISELTGLSFHQILLVEDTLVVFGNKTRNDTTIQWGVFFAKMDTLGNILDYKTHYLEEGYNTVFTDGAKVIKTSDGGYAIIGNNHTLAHLMLFKLDVNGEKEFFKEYPDSTIFQVWHRDIVEFEHGYIYLGEKQQMDDGLNDAFAMRLDKEGNVVWEIEYGEYGLSEGFERVVKRTENEFLIFGGQGETTPTVNPNLEAGGINFELKIDSLGNILSLYETDYFLLTEGLGKFFRKIQFNENDEAVSLSRISYVEEVLGEPTLLAQPALIGWDEEYNILWHTTFKDASNTAGKNRFNALAQTPDNGWVAVGSYSNVLNYNTYTQNGVKPRKKVL